MTRTVIIFSGGADSACYAAALAAKHELYGLTFSYGQRASKEITAAKRLAKKIGIKSHKVVDIGFMRGLYGSSNRLTGAGKIPQNFEDALVVPVRNAVFLSVAAAWAFSVGADTVAYGAHTGDHKYPDCRPAFAQKMIDALNLGEADRVRSKSSAKLKITSPYMQGRSKKDLLKRGYEILGDAIFETWSCYGNGRRHCGVCESCRNRKGAFLEAKIPDQTVYS